MEKVCTACKALLPLDNFYSDSSHKDGKGSRCKECANAAMKKWRAAHTREELDRRRIWRKTEHAKKLMYEQHRRRKERDPLKVKARHAISNGIRDGRVQRQPCEVCGSLKVHAHHSDYSRPFDVRWLCEQHHLHTHHKEQRC